MLWLGRQPPLDFNGISTTNVLDYLETITLDAHPRTVLQVPDENMAGGAANITPISVGETAQRDDVRERHPHSHPFKWCISPGGVRRTHNAELRDGPRVRCFKITRRRSYFRRVGHFHRLDAAWGPRRRPATCKQESQENRENGKLLHIVALRPNGGTERCG